ncbi:hypothetical protein UlMin_037474, partial [Ulmus minor]
EMSKAVVRSSIVFEVLDQHNYVDWSEALEAYFKARDLWDVVRFYQQPPKIIEKKKFKAWERRNAAALHAIKISCGTNMLPIIRGFTEANEAWLCLKACFKVPPSVSESQIFSGVQADEENVDNEHKKAYEELDNAFSKSNLCDAIALCKKYPRLLIEKLPNNRLILNELITLGGLDQQEKVEEIMQLEQFDELLKYLSGERYFSNRTPLEVAVCVEATQIAIRLIQMNSTLLFFPDTLGHIPMAVAIGSHLNKMANLLYLHTPHDFWTRENNVALTAGVITKSFEVDNLDIALKLLKSRPDEFILTKDYNGKTPLYAAASAPHLFRRTYRFPFLPGCICKVLGPRLPLGWMNFEISGMELLILLGNAIRDRTDNQTKIEIVSEAFFEAIKRENFNFILMLINSIKRIVYLTDDKSRNMYMLAIAHRNPKLFSLFFWDKQDQELKLDASLFKDKWQNNLLHMVGASTPPTALDRMSKPALQMKRELMWFK